MKIIYIPANIDIDGLLKTNPPDIKYFHKDKLMYILGLISNLHIKRRDDFNASRYASPIYSRLLNSIIRFYRSYLDYLIKNGVIEKVGKYNIDAGISNSYQFTTRYLFVELVEYRITYKPLLENLSRRYKKERMMGSRALIDSKNAISAIHQQRINKINNLNNFNNAEATTLTTNNHSLPLYVERSVKNLSETGNDQESAIDQKKSVPESEKEKLNTINHSFPLYVIHSTEIENNVRNDTENNSDKENENSKIILKTNNVSFPLYVIHNGTDQKEELHPIFRQEELLKRLDFCKCIYSKVDSLEEDPYRNSILMAKVEKIRNRDIFTSVDLTGYRYHSNITNLKRELRPFLRYIGETGKESIISEIDLKNSQPFFSLVLLREEFWTEENNLFLRRNLFRKNNSEPEITSMFNLDKGKSGKKLNEIEKIREFVSKIPKEAIDFYKEIVITGDLYHTMQQSIQIRFKESELRPMEEVKKEFMKILFSGNQYQSIYKIIFTCLFPEVVQLFNMIKKKRKERLAILLQRIESNIVINKIYWDIYNYNKDIPVFTIHDSIVTIVEYEQEVLKIVKDCFDKYVGFQPTLKVEHWIEDSDKQIAV